jgi:Papain family cysteine protease
MPTIKELRAELAARNARWTPDARFQDNDQVAALHKRGGTIPAPVPPEDLLTRERLFSIISSQSSNAFIANRRKEQDYLLPKGGRSQSQTNEVPGGAPAGTLSAPPPPPAPPTSVDWRNRFGWPWITSIQDQDPCESCWAFTAAALIESMVRIEHCVWAKSSELQIRQLCNAQCGDGGNPPYAMRQVAANNGVIGEDAVPWSTSNNPIVLPADASARLMNFPLANWNAGQFISNVAAGYPLQKAWLDLVLRRKFWLRHGT